MANQSSILNDHDLKKFTRMAINIILEKKYIGAARDFRIPYTYSSRTQ